jgi:hypothetical protein
MKISLDIPDHRIADLLCTACEGGSNYWIRKASGLPYKDAVPGAKHVGDEGWGKLALNLPVTFWDYEEDSAFPNHKHQLTLKKVKNGLALMAENESMHFGHFMSENEDATTADVFLQCALFGEVVYG